MTNETPEPAQEEPVEDARSKSIRLAREAHEQMARARGVPLITNGSDGEGPVKRFAVVRDSDRTIVNFILLRQKSSWAPLEGHSAYEAPEDFVGDIGWREVRGTWIAPDGTTSAT